MKKGINKYISALMMGTALVAVPSCTDTWNEHYLAEDSYTATESLWELIEKREDLSNFKNILSNAKFYRDETHPAYTISGNKEEGYDTTYYTFKDILNANSPITIWAPSNDALSAEDWEKFAQMAEEDGYNLQQQFIGNHISLYRKTMSKDGVEAIRLINNKIANVNYNESKIEKSNAYVTEKNIGARNGLLHIIDKQNDFFFNLYEYVKFSGEVTTFRDYLVSRDTIYFSESSSIEGLPDENGNPTYVDSVYFIDNMMFNHATYNPTDIDAEEAWMNNLKMFRAQINTEDSTFIMIVPTDMAWENATQKLSPYYNYVKTYPRMDKVWESRTRDVVLSIDTLIDSWPRRSYPNGKGYGSVDSLQNVNIDMDIVHPLVFNLNLQPKPRGREWTIDEFVNGGYNECDYLLTTTGDTIRDIVENGVTVWRKSSLFEDGKLAGQEMSNGYAILTNKWNYPRSYWMRDIDIDVNQFNDYGQRKANTILENRTINNNTTEQWIDKYGRCSEQQYLHVRGNGPTVNPEVQFALRGSKFGEANVMSGKYDVQIVLVPNWYDNTVEEPIREDTLKNRLECSLHYWTEDMIKKNNLSFDKQKSFKSDVIEYDGEKVDTITIMTDVEFPISYKNIREAYPVLHIKSVYDTEYDNHSRSFNIDRIILKSKVGEI